MSFPKCVFLSTRVLIIWMVFVIVWNYMPAIFVHEHRKGLDMRMTPTAFADKEIRYNGRRWFNRTFVIDIQDKVTEVMKPWQTVQIFAADVDPGDMIVKKSYKDIVKSNALNRTHWFGQRVKSCALVGNSGILLNSHCGEVIDEADVIIRMNLALFGHEYSSAVGSRVSIMTINRVKSCALVGNSGILLNSHCGEVIDEADVIIRMNLAVFGNEYSSAVGSRVSIMTINALQIKELVSCFEKSAKNETKNGTISKYLSKLQPRCNSLIDRLRLLKSDNVIMPARGYFPQLVDMLPFLRRQFNLNFRVSYNPKDLITVSKRLWHFNSPSTGLGVYTAATQLCEEITLYGFYPFHEDPFNRKILHHYYEPKAKINYTSNCHEMPEEYRFLLELDRQGAIRMMNNCTPS
eukprot:XP_011675533.1 PREDICTED: CMP-N-acetylneuraminate-poly-alpha-2,8-sialyltransferase-like [Strongylocentrotus purpuratus]